MIFISGKGQITIPVSVRNALKLKTGDKIVIEEAFAGEAEKAGFTSGEEMQGYMKEIRTETLWKSPAAMRAKEVCFEHNHFGGNCGNPHTQ